VVVLLLRFLLPRFYGPPTRPDMATGTGPGRAGRMECPGVAWSWPGTSQAWLRTWTGNGPRAVTAARRVARSWPPGSQLSDIMPSGASVGGEWDRRVDRWAGRHG